jgi:PAS domain S-box-containing protein
MGGPPNRPAVTSSTALVGPHPAPLEVERAVRAKTRPLLIERLRLTLLLVVISLSFFLVQDLLFYHDQLSALLLIKGVQFTAAAAVWWLIRTDRVPRNTVVFAFCLGVFFCALATLAGIVRGSASGSALLFIIITATTAIGLPWGAWAQAAFVGVCAILLVWNDYAIAGPPLQAMIGPASGAMLTAGLVSVFVARSVERYRFQIEEREMGLRLREELFRSLIENGDDLIVVVGADDLIQYVSPSVRRLLGYEPDAWMGMRFFDLIHPEDVPRLREALAACAPEGAGVQSIEVRLRNSAQAWRALDGTIANLLANEAVRGFVFNARDITLRRQAETDLRRNQAELTHVLRLGTISEIAAALGHEINQPLAAISNYASACARRLDPGSGSSPELQRGLQLISAEALRAGRIVRSLRDLSRKGEAGMEVIDVNAVVQRAVELMEPQARLQGIAVRVQTAKDLPGVYADGIQIEQVVLNLLLNGIESMHASPVRILSASTARHDERIEVCVRDTGVGLDPAARDRVFEPFFTTKPTGLGMGLAISRRIIEAHGGAFRVVPNSDGRGSSFSFWLPLARRDKVRQLASAGAPQRG